MLSATKIIKQSFLVLVTYYLFVFSFSELFREINWRNCAIEGRMWVDKYEEYPIIPYFDFIVIIIIKENI